MARTVSDEIIYPCPHFEGCIVGEKFYTRLYLNKLESIVRALSDAYTQAIGQ